MSTKARIEGSMDIVNTASLIGKHVWLRASQEDASQKSKDQRPSKTERDRKIGRVRYFVFHSTKPLCIGMLVKRPDVALMFHRKDEFIAFDAFTVDLQNTHEPIQIDGKAFSSGKELCKSLGVKLDDCVIWQGMAVVAEASNEDEAFVDDAAGNLLGTIDNIGYHRQTGRIQYIDVSQNATSNAVLGSRRIDVSLIKGFKRGIGTPLYMADDDDTHALGAILVDAQAEDIEEVGGIAAKAGEASAQIADVTKKKTAEAVDVARDIKDKALDSTKEVRSAIREKTGGSASEAMEKGAYATGRQLQRAKGMFSRFKEEYDKARNDD